MKKESDPTSSPVMRCAVCGAKNRIPPEKTVCCGRCKTLLDPDMLPDGHPREIQEADFEGEVLRAPVPVLLDCWAPWCQPCLMLAPELANLARELTGRLKVCKLDVDKNPALAARLDIRGIPALFLYDNGRQVKKMTGFMGVEGLIHGIKPYLY